MSLATRLKINRQALSETGLSGASGSTFTANSILPGRSVPGTLTARAAISITATSTTVSPKWQVSNDATTWVDVKPANGAAIVGATASTTLWLQGPPALQANKYARLALVTSGSSNTTSSSLKWAVSYNYEEAVEWYSADVRTKVGLTTTSATGSAPATTITGPTLKLNDVEPGALCANVTFTIKTSSLTLAPKWQVSDGGGTWEDFKMTNNPANVVAVTGTGSSVATTYAFEAPASLCSHKYARMAIVTGGASVTAQDDLIFSYNYVERPLK